MMTKEEKVEKAEMTELIGKLKALDTHDVEVTSEGKGHDTIIDSVGKNGLEKEGFSTTKGTEDAVPVGDQESKGHFVKEGPSQEFEKSIVLSKGVTLDLIEEILDKVIYQVLTVSPRGEITGERKEEKMSKEERVKKYLEFVRLWSETHKAGGESEKRREANVVWKQKIEDGQSVSEVNYLEQTGVIYCNN